MDKNVTVFGSDDRTADRVCVGRIHEGPPVHPSWIDPEELRKNEELCRAAEAARQGRTFHHPV